MNASCCSSIATDSIIVVILIKGCVQIALILAENIDAPSKGQVELF